MYKLTIEIGGRMHQDWDNEVFSWDMDNLIKITLDGELILSKSFKDFYIFEESKDVEKITNTIDALNYYSIEKLKTCQAKTENGETIIFPYTICNLKSTEKTTVKYGKWHLKAELDLQESFQIADLIFVKLENLANAIGSGEPNFASIVCLAGHGEIFFKEVASNIKDQYDVDL